MWKLSRARLKILPFPDATFDLAFSQDAFIHAVSKKKTYEEAYRVTKAGGAFVFCDLMAGDEMDLTESEQQKFTESNVLNDWLTPAENVQVVPKCWMEASGVCRLDGRHAH